MPARYKLWSKECTAGASGFSQSRDGRDTQTNRQRHLRSSHQVRRQHHARYIQRRQSYRIQVVQVCVAIPPSSLPFLPSHFSHFLSLRALHPVDAYSESKFKYTSVRLILPNAAATVTPRTSQRCRIQTTRYSRRATIKHMTPNMNKPAVMPQNQSMLPLS